MKKTIFAQFTAAAIGVEVSYCHACFVLRHIDTFGRYSPKKKWTYLYARTMRG